MPPDDLGARFLRCGFFVRVSTRVVISRALISLLFHIDPLLRGMKWWLPSHVSSNGS